MNAFRAETRKRAAAGLGLAALVCAVAPMAGGLSGYALAQSAAPSPVPLVPQNILRVLPPSGAAAGKAPGTATATAPGGAGLTGQGGLGSGQPQQRVRSIEVNPLAEIAPEAIGTLGGEDGGFGIDMWNGTPREVIDGLLQRLPGRMPSPAMRDLTRRLLLSVAPPPAGRPRTLASAGADTQGLAAMGAGMPSRLLVLRAERLAELGEVPALVSLLSVVPAHVEEESLERLRVESLFLSHDRKEACRLVRNGIAVHHALPFWQKAMIFCNMAGGDLDRGMLGLDLMREQGIQDDPLFFALANLFLGVKGALPKSADLTPLHLAMMREAGQDLPDGALAQATPGLLYAIATDPKAKPAMRAAAAELACAQGIIDGAALARGYAAMSFTSDQLGNPIGAAPGLEGPAARALLYQAALKETLPATRAEVLRVALDIARENGLFPVAVRLYRPLVAEIEAAPQLTWFAASAGRVLYGAGEPEWAGAWLALGRQEAIIDPQASAAVAALWPYSRLAGGDSYAAELSLATWQDMREASGSETPPHALGWLRSAFQALGEPDPLPWRVLAAQQAAPKGAPQATGQAERPGTQYGARPMPDASIVHALEDASETRRVGETVLLSLIALGNAGPGGAHDMALGAALSALSRIGLGREARALAIEGAMAHGV